MGIRGARRRMDEAETSGTSAPPAFAILRRYTPGSIPLQADIVAMLEQSRYALRMILMLHASGPATVTWLVRNIRTSPNTVVRCAHVLESSGLVVSWRETGGRNRHLYGLTRLGEAVALRAPIAWSNP